MRLIFYFYEWKFKSTYFSIYSDNFNCIFIYFAMDFQNLTNHQNVFLKRYNASAGRIGTVYQIGFFPDILWRVQF